MKIDYRKVQLLMIRHTNKPIGELCKSIGISRQSYYNLINNNKGFNIVTLNKICKYFNKNPTDYLIID